MPELMTSSSPPAGIATSVYSIDRVSRNNACPSLARVTAIWSMMPTGAPTKSFSAFLASQAKATSSRGRSYA